jgi:GNAT superfamily N-acetyltransferase
MEQDIHFRAAHTQDHAAIEAMTLAFYQEETYDAPMTEAKITRTLQELAHHPDKGQVWVFATAETVVGYAIIIHYWSNEYGGNIAVIDEIYTLSAWRGRGIARDFIEFLAALPALDWVGMMLEVVPTHHRAMNYYQRLGFEPDSNRHFFRLLQNR